MADFGEEAKENAQEDLILWRRREARVRVPMGRGKNLGEQCSSHNNAFEDLEQSRRFRPPKPMEKASHGRATTASESARVGFRKNDLNSASLFCPSGSSSNKEANSTHEKYGALDLSPRPSVMAEVSQSNFAGGKENVSVLLGMMDNLCITDSISKPQIYLPPHRRNLQPSRQPLFVAQSASAPKTSHALESMDLKSSSTESSASTTAPAGKGKSCISSRGMTLDGANHNAPPSAQPTSKQIMLRGYVHGFVWSDDELSDSNPSDEEQEPIPEDEIDTWILNHQKPPIRHHHSTYPRPEPDPYEDDPTLPDARRGWVP